MGRIKMAETEDPRFVDYVGEAKYNLTYETEALADVSKSLLNAELSAQALSRVVAASEAAALNMPTVANALEDTDIDPKSYPYIGYDLRDFLCVMIELDSLLAEDPDYKDGNFRYRPVRFLEVGCGPGRNLYVLRNGGILLWSTLEGIDVVGPYIEAARNYYSLGESVWEDDALTLDYTAYDVVFSHRPFVDHATEAEYEMRFVSQLKRGAYVVAPLSETHAEDTRLVALGESQVIWKRL